ncbi:DUF4303 domain-containing protein [Aureliella helgolandensis]|uniref:DUF4303 domain-containing protein n=1 Tax=Aureliella helgolandensis TaxID=2527968 RepID=A0A518G126_9BACT|nr:DUF4303 domain-containing protein [Aureliella helgolandensis]QDV22240.1 hypothetical protein Q31a_05240 [Aureliella helgolandensis]
MNNVELLSKLHSELRDAIASHYVDLTHEFDDVCGYAVCAPSTFEHIIPAYQLTSELRDRPTDSLGLASYFPPEWNSFGTIFFDDGFNSLVAEISNRLWGDDCIEPSAAYEAILKVLIDLEREGIFGPRSTDRFVTMWDVGGDESMIIATSEKLNSPDLHSHVLTTFGRNT